MRRFVPVLGAAAVLVVVSLAQAGTGAAVGPPAPQGGLVLHYPMETLAQGAVSDDSGNALDGHVVAATGTPRLVPSLQGYGNALQLTGSGHQYVSVPQSPLLDVNTYTLSAWVRYTGIQNDKTLGRWEVLEKADAYWMNVRTNGLVRVGGFYGGCSGSSVWQYLDSTRAIPTARWEQLSATYDGTWLRVYINGWPAGAKQVTGQTCASGKPLAVGAKSDPAKGLLEAFWDGRLDDVRIYDRALSATEIRQLATRP
jgi:hypothetical protein